MSRIDEITRYVVAEFAPDIRADELDADYDLLDNGVVDSLGLLRLIGWLGERYDLPVDDIDLAPEQFRSVRAVDAFVESALVKGPAL
ncbi:phosphopantetheine-binding protein [Actinokineospora terrae]|uniref:Phosphopantetheine attachment site n=1 Tax=Actinokineospora terrae TaxID=155974 RepID=A0A1H9XAK8_9PSEU|nr:phosphopantetheine-binding protein [Actinokineospora terrae]SES42907.1 Phosphopantetheine attachment site [Actinokineospora terrae]